MELKLNKKRPLLITVMGNKDNDIKEFIKYLPKNINKVVECFGGSFALCRRIYYDDKYIKVVNDNDKNLYELYTNGDELLYLLIKICDMTFENINQFKTYLKTENDYNKYYDFFLKKFSFFNSYKSTDFRKYKKYYDEQINFMKKINFRNEDYKNIITDPNIINDKDAFLFFDPPYILSYNSDYDMSGSNVCKMILDIYHLFKNPDVKCKMMLIINKNPFIEFFFKDFIKGEYQKIYQRFKKKDTLLIITNYD